MKVIQLILRIIFSPFVFIISFGAMTLFPGFLCLILGIGQLVSFVLGMTKYNKTEIYEIIKFSTLWFWFPFINTKEFIFKASFIK